MDGSLGGARTGQESMADSTRETVEMPVFPRIYATLPSMLRRFDRTARRDRFTGHTAEDFLLWQEAARKQLRELLGLDQMFSEPSCGSALSPVRRGEVLLPQGIRREEYTISAEEDVVLPFYVLVPPDAGRHTRIFLCPPGHGGGGKSTVAGLREYPAIAERISLYNYDYGLQLARLGYVAVCPDARGFGERREDPESASRLPEALGGDCARLARMGEPLGIPAAGMLVYDLMRLIDYLVLRDEWDTQQISCLGFSGGGMQTLFLTALEPRVRFAVISGYLYGYRDSLLRQSWNCSCNYIPHLFEHFDMGDIASLIAPRPLLVQSCRADRQNGPEGMDNVYPQTEILRDAYTLLGHPERFFHDVCEGPHCFHGERLPEIFRQLL